MKHHVRGKKTSTASFLSDVCAQEIKYPFVKRYLVQRGCGNIPGDSLSHQTMKDAQRDVSNGEVVRKFQALTLKDRPQVGQA